MSRILSLLIVTITGSLVFVQYLGCAPAAPSSSESPKVEKPKRPARISLAEVDWLIRHKIYSETHTALDAEFGLKELTTDLIWRELGVQVFQITEGFQQCETFVAKNGDVTRIGRGHGGNGVQSMCVADLDNDGKPELVYSFSWGSGIHRSEVGVLTFGRTGVKEYVAPFAYRYPGGLGELTLKRVGKQVIVFDGPQRLGQFMLEKKGEKWVAAVRLDENLPKEFRERVWKYQK